MKKALLSKQMGFLNIETAACLFNMTVLNLPLFHHFDKLPAHLLSLLLFHFRHLFSLPTLSLSFEPEEFKGNFGSQKEESFDSFCNCAVCFFFVFLKAVHFLFKKAKLILSMKSVSDLCGKSLWLPANTATS